MSGRSLVDGPGADAPEVAGGTDAGEAPIEVRLSILAVPRFLRLARLTASGLAGDLGFSVDEIEDLRVAVDELAAAVIEDAAPGTVLELVYRELAGGLEVEGRCPTPGETAPELHIVARELLGILADEYRVALVDGDRTFWLRKSGR